VLLTAGAINSPKLLELSGIGNPDIVRGLGIEPVLASPGVGENLQDHLQIRTVFRVEGTKTLNTLYHSPLGKVSMALRYALTQSGPLSMAPSQFGICPNSDPSRPASHHEYEIQPLPPDPLGDPSTPLSAITVSVGK